MVAGFATGFEIAFDQQRAPFHGDTVNTPSRVAVAMLSRAARRSREANI
jgi:hypothetical protein